MLKKLCMDREEFKKEMIIKIYFIIFIYIYIYIYI